MIGLESISNRSVLLNAKPPITKEQYKKLNKITLDSADAIKKSKLERTPKQDKTSFTSDKGEKVTFSEGVKLVAKGFVGKIGEMFKSIIKHPVKVLGAVTLTTVGLSLLPLIGISAATGAAGLAIGFAAIAIGKTVMHTAQAIKHNNSGEYNEVRKDLIKIGGDSLDLALSLPFVPKGIKQIQNQFKYTSGIKFNSELWNTVKNTKGIWNKLKELSKADLQISYNQYKGEMGLNFAPELEFVDYPINIAGGYDFNSGRMAINSRWVNPFTTPYMQGIVKHELTHFKQAAYIARTEGLGAEAIAQVQERALERELETLINPTTNTQPSKLTTKQKILAYTRQKLMKFLESHPKVKEKYTNFMIKEAEKMTNMMFDIQDLNLDFYNKIVETQGKIAAGTQEAKLAAAYLEAYENYPSLLRISAKHPSYANNLLELDANIAKKQVTKLHPKWYSAVVQAIANISDNPELK